MSHLPNYRLTAKQEKVRWECNVCQKRFKPMTEKQLVLAEMIHLSSSERHKEYLALGRP